MAKLAGTKDTAFTDLYGCTVYGCTVDTLKEFHRLSTEKAVREALEKAALIADEVNYHIGSKIRALIPEGEKSCSHDWEDAGNQYFDNGDICTKCGATRR